MGCCDLCHDAMFAILVVTKIEDKYLLAVPKNRIYIHITVKTYIFFFISHPPKLIHNEVFLVQLVEVNEAVILALCCKGVGFILAAFVYESRSRDSKGASFMLAVASPGSQTDIAPTWLVTDATSHSKQEFQRDERSNKSITHKRNDKGDAKGKAKGKGKDKGRGRGASQEEK